MDSNERRLIVAKSAIEAIIEDLRRVSQYNNDGLRANVAFRVDSAIQKLQALENQS